jgi:hypothetical protein
MEEKNISEHESLLIIQQMIQSAKREQRDNGKGWILWGWMLFLASTLTVLNLHFRWFQTWFFWNLFGIATFVIYPYEMISRRFSKKARQVRTYTKDLVDKLNIGFFVSLMFIIVWINVKEAPTSGFPLLINLYAFWILIYGTALNFKPSIIGAAIAWAIGIGALFVKTFEWVMIMHALAVLFGYIIPGHLAHIAFKKTGAGQSV